MFNTEVLEKHLATSWLGRSVYFFEELPSTNSYAKRIECDSSLHGALFLTDYQTGGRGQYDRTWNTNPGENLTFSLVFEPKKAERFTLLTLACALAVTEVINKYSGLRAMIKWPNDVLHNKKKLCGILTETQFTGNKLERIVVGIGLNVNQVEFPGELREVATSLRRESSKKYSREKLLVEILQNIEYRYRLWNQFNTDLVKQINHKMIGYGEWTNLLLNEEKLEGQYKFLGVNESGELVAVNRELDIKTFSYEQVRVQC
ncbi:MAG: biotin--[acetyl-CoA-carboxylase] ligase [Gracilimonas sp.]|uniref:biotin--[acetyl-CoA-carboxylase] ligase n=1 Tax=Gracilimonas sp. TaxID=1974203 RepID=UPI00198F748F|nr:biotin--[acetyl-CoA-carboxylase] ligase [Gracilimonas sp.]MBD3617571.1 biotin--[acetyl-CoA-carboxylase] ligase [Gracilimonas sp.]